MNKPDIQKMIGLADITLAHAMQEIDSNSRGILFLVDEHGKLTACITDGDIRRFLLSGGKLDAPAIQAANRNPKTARDPGPSRPCPHGFRRIRSGSRG